MSALDGTITFATSEYRPCLAKGQHALFHRWEDNSEIYAPSLMVGGHGGGVVKYTCAIVEYEDGHVERVKPEDVTFVDHLFKEYAFPPTEEEAAADLVGFEQNRNGLRNTEEYIQCPLCKGENKSAVVFFDGPAKEYFVYCKACGLETVDVFKTKAAAIKAFTAGKTRKITEGGANNDG